MKLTKLKVYIVLEYNNKGHSRILGVYSTEESARRKTHRVYRHGNTYHVIKKSVQGTEDFGELIFKLKPKDAKRKL